MNADIEETTAVTESQILCYYPLPPHPQEIRDMGRHFDVIGFLECGLHELGLPWLNTLIQEGLGDDWTVEPRAAYVVAARKAAVRIHKVALGGTG